MLRRAIRSRRLLVAGGVGAIVGIGMALFAPIFDQSPLWLGVGAGTGAALLMLFAD
jgi:hypothetical protein